MFMVYIIGFVFKAQINLMWFLKEFKVSKILCVIISNTICISSFDTKCVHHTMETPLSLKTNQIYLKRKKKIQDVMSICYQNINSTKIVVVIIILGGFNVLHLLLFFEEKNECFMKFQEFKSICRKSKYKKDQDYE